MAVACGSRSSMTAVAAANGSGSSATVARSGPSRSPRVRVERGSSFSAAFSGPAWTSGVSHTAVPAAAAYRLNSSLPHANTRIIPAA
ncbi:hypothetical protein DZF91_26530 [Actinomadura logoneensis]|uniref:Uncharacterized protein n=1 Tax=Actinomadura logoneensis TaxID=2293572 RepID=A0A372JF81_9ACTN|nr:hypothetical protein DZF91_26530 [Actinomadura logoneensis]